MVLPAAAAGAVKGKAAANMAKTFTMMNKIDWEGVNNAMQSIKDFGMSASLIQETLGDIKDGAQSLVDIALGDALSTTSEKAFELIEQLIPLATEINKLTSAMDTTQIDALIKNLKIFNMLMENSDVVLKKLFGWLIPIIEWVLGVDLTPTTGGGGGALNRGITQITKLEGGY